MRKTDSVEASNADNTAVGENSRKVRNLHYISQIRICEKLSAISFESADHIEVLFPIATPPRLRASSAPVEI